MKYFMFLSWILKLLNQAIVFPSSLLFNYWLLHVKA